MIKKSLCDTVNNIIYKMALGQNYDHVITILILYNGF